MRIRIGFVVSEFNQDVTSKMLASARKRVESLGAIVKYICYVPGVFDMPLMIENLLRKKDIDSVVTLGAVIKGETKHDEIIAQSTARTIVDLSLKYGKPVTLGISGPNMSKLQAKNRINAISIRAVTAAVLMTGRLRKLHGARAKRLSVIR